MKKTNHLPFIEFFENHPEKTLPCIRLTKSRNGQTGTATFLFFQPTSLTFFCEEKKLNISLIYNNKKISTQNITIYFKRGKPIVVKAIFLFKSNNEWLSFLQFMFIYSQYTGLSFFEKKK